MTYAVSPPPVISVPVAGGKTSFPIRRVFCIGRNYDAHAAEMGFAVDREEPFFFLKPADNIVQDGADIPFPPATSDFHHEIELVVAIGLGGQNISKDKAADHVFGYAIGNDLTRRDLQIAARSKGRPWEAGKVVDHSAPLGTIFPTSVVGHPTKGRIWLSVNDEIRQEGDISQLVWSVAELIEFLSSLYELVPGDLIFTGTPAGVGPIQRGDVVRGGIEGLGEISNRVV